MTSSPIRWDLIRAEYEQGASLRSLARTYGVSKTYLIEKRDKEEWNRPTTDRPRDVRVTPQKAPTTQDKQAAFLDAYAEHANILLSAQKAGISRKTVYTWLEHDEAFSFAFNQAKEDAKDVIRGEIYRRAIEGWDEPVPGQRNAHPIHHSGQHGKPGTREGGRYYCVARQTLAKVAPPLRNCTTAWIATKALAA